MTKELKQTALVWPKLKDTLSVPHTESEYQHMRAFLDRLIDEVGEDEQHPLASLMETVGNLVEIYEAWPRDPPF